MLRTAATFCLGFLASIAVTMNAYTGAAQPARLGAILVLLLFLHVLVRGRVWIPREFALYYSFAAYNALSIAWTPDVTDAIPNLQLTANFCLVLTLFGSLVAFYRRGPVLAGVLCGFLAGAALYTLVSGFPLHYPEDFSYNTIAGMYLFGLFVTVTFGWYRRSRLLPIALGLILTLLVAATTSIKTNLGILLGAAAAAMMQIRASLRAIRHNLITVAILAGALVYFVSTSDALMERVQAGYDRVSLGANVLVARDEAKGDAGLGMRENWKNLGIKGWLSNPIFGYGVEAFRGDFGVTSHSTPVDLLYNTGLIGCCLFYGMFAVMGLRLLNLPAGRDFRALALAVLTCYGFISLSGTMYYDAFLAATVAISAALLERQVPVPSGLPVGATA